MKKLYFILSMALCTISAQAVKVLPKTVQGIPYSSTLPEIRPDMIFEDRMYTAAPDGQFTFDMIESWVGEGSNEAALVIQWNSGKASEKTALVFGYRWDGQATGIDMLKAVAKANPRLYTLMQYTNVSSPTDPNGGYTVNGIGWDADDNGLIQLRDTGHNNQIYKSEDGFFEHPRGYVPGQGGSSDYDYDNWEAVDPNDYWQAGWYSKGFWSYWVKGSASASFSFSSRGASGRLLTDGCWDGWNFEAGFSLSDWLPFESAPAPIPADAKTQFTVNGLCYTLKNYTSKTVVVSAPFVVDGAAAAEYKGEMTVPTTFTDDGVQYTVVGIGEGAFQGSKVTKVTLPGTVAEIGKMAFEGSALTEINVGNAIKKIGDYAFMGCGIKAAFFPESMTEIAEGTYYGTAVTSAIIPSYITSIGDNAFAACEQLTEINMPKTIKTLGKGLFADCDAVASVTTDATYPLVIDEDMFSTKAYTNATLNIPSGFKPAYSKATGWSGFTNVKEFNIEVNIGDKFALDGVTYQITAVGNSATAKVTYCNFEGKVTYSAITAANKAGYTGIMTVPAEITYQGCKFVISELNDSSFYGASELTGVTLPGTITRIPGHLFNGCSKLAGVNIPDAVTEIGDYAFNNCAVVENIVLPEGLLSIGRNAFSGCKVMRDVVIPVGVTVIPQYAFQNCASIETMILGDQIKTVEMYAFNGCGNLKNVRLPEGLTELPQAVFRECKSLASLEIPSTVTKMGNYVFEGCSSLVIDIPQQLTSMGNSVFKDCTSLKTAVIPSAITSIPNSLFQNCMLLEQVTMSDKVTQIGTNVFNKCQALKTLTVAGGADEVSAAGCTLPSGLTRIMANAFQNCTALKLNPDMPASLTQIGNYAFDGMTRLTAINLPEGFKTFGQYSFRNTAVSEIVVPKTVADISVNYAFVGCKKVYITNPVPGSIYANTFKESSSQYVTVIVPSGTKVAFDSKSNYWKNSHVTEPELAVTFEGSRAKATDSGAELSATLNVDYADSTIPERFRKADAANLNSGKVQLLYKVSDSAEEKTAVDAAVGADNGVTVNLAGLTASTGYVYNWAYTLGSIAVSAPEQEFTTLSQTTGVDGIRGDARNIVYMNGALVINGFEGYTFSVCDLSGAVCRTVRCGGAAVSEPMDLSAGVYVVYGKSDTDRVAVKISVR